MSLLPTFEKHLCRRKLSVAALFIMSLFPALNASAVSYPEMSRTFTNNSGQQNRYLRSVTTAGTLTPTVFECASVADLPYTAFNVGANTYTAAGALIDKTANPIVVDHGTRSFTMTYYAWSDAINGNGSEADWTQEGCFIDWNGDGKFEGSDEIYPKGWTTVPNKEVFTGATRTVTIPEGQAPGTYRMRVVFFEPANNSEAWPSTLFTTLNGRIRNGISYDMALTIGEPKPMTVAGLHSYNPAGRASAGATGVAVARLEIATEGSMKPLSLESVKVNYSGTSASDISNLRWVRRGSDAPLGATVAKATPTMLFTPAAELASGSNTLLLLADIAADATLGNTIRLDVEEVTIGGVAAKPELTASKGLTVTNEPDYTLGNAIWFDEPTSSTAGAAVWNRDNFATSSSNPDQIWERRSLPIGNGSFGGNVLGSVNRERVVLNEKTLWKGGPATGAEAYWDMNRTVSPSTLDGIRSNLERGSTSAANSQVVANYSGKINYDSNRFGSFTTMGEAYVSTGIDESAVSNYKRILNIDRSIAVVDFDAAGSHYTRRYFASFPDNVMVWNYATDGSDQNLTFSFNNPQVTDAVEAVDGGLLYRCSLANNGMQWAMRVYVRVNGAGSVKADPAARTITVSGADNVDFILAAATDYVMNFDPDMTDPKAFVGVDPVESVNSRIDAASRMSYDDLYARHYDDYASLYDRTSLAINPAEHFENIPTPSRLAAYRSGTLDHALEQTYFQYGRYLLISSSREGTMPANLQGLWHNNTEGPWRVDYHNNINLQMNYWPATTTNLLECFTPLVDYVRGLVVPGRRTAKAYYGARGWTAEVSTNIFGFTAPLNSSDMSWNYNPTAGPWLASQIWDYYDFTRDEQWLREIGYPIIKESADFCSDLLYLTNGTYTSAPSYSPEHGTADLGATYANAVTREVLAAAIKGATILGVDSESVGEWQTKLDKMYPYQVGRYGQLQEWYNDIDTYNDTHRHTNHLFGLHPGSTINPLTDQRLADACKETLRQRGDAATGWSMGWKLNHWARLLDGDHAYILFRNLLKEGTADNLWDMHPPFQIDGNFGGTAGVAELFLQSHGGELFLLPALPSAWTDGEITGLLARGNFKVDIAYADGKLTKATIVSNVGGDCNVRYAAHTLTFPTEPEGIYFVTYDPTADRLEVEKYSTLSDAADQSGARQLKVVASAGKVMASVSSDAPLGKFTIEICNIAGQVMKVVEAQSESNRMEVNFDFAAAPGYYLMRASGAGFDLSRKFTIR